MYAVVYRMREHGVWRMRPEVFYAEIEAQSAIDMMSCHEGYIVPFTVPVKG